MLKISRGNNVQMDLECLSDIDNKQIQKFIKKMEKIISYTHKGVTYERSLIPVEVEKLKKYYKKIKRVNYQDKNENDDFEYVIKYLGQSLDQYYKAYIDPHQMECELRHFQNLWKHVKIVEEYKKWCKAIGNSSN